MTRLLFAIRCWLNGYCDKHQRMHELIGSRCMGAEVARCPECGEEN